MKSVVVLLMFAILAVNSKSIPHQLSKFLCAKSVPNYQKCMRETLEEFLATAFKGVPEFEVPPMNPLKISQMNINSKFGEFGKVNGTLQNVVIDGIEGIKVDRFTSDLASLSAVLHVTIPSVLATMKYDLDAEILRALFSSKGIFKGKFTDVKLLGSGSLKRVDREGIEYFELDNYELNILFGTGKIELLTEDSAKQETADYLATIFNKNFQLVMQLIKPFVVPEGTQAARDFLNYYLSKAPAAEWIPD